MVDRIQQITNLGQAVWLDFISRDLLRSGQLRELINAGVTGMTSNPSIFQKAVATGTDYDEQIRELARAGKDAHAVYEALAIRDIADAADQLRPTYNEKDGRDGFVSIEVDPRLAHDTHGTVYEARRLFKAVDRPNVLIKVPATEAGLPAITTLIGEGINVNVTLIFAIPMYEKVMQAYIDGLRRLEQAERSMRRVASVASFFVSRIDTLVDRLLTERIEKGDQKLATLRGQAAVACAKIAYDRYKAVFEAEPFAKLGAAGARIQRPLWASTSTKNPDYADTKYVEDLIGPNTVNTMPPQTLEAVRNHGSVARTVDLDVEEAYALIERLSVAGIDMKAVGEQLLAEGVQKFADSFEQMLNDTETKRAKFGR
jgi:transaldolase